MGCSFEFDPVNTILNFISHIIYYSLRFFIEYTFKGQVHVFVGRVKIVRHSSSRTSAILKYICTLSGTIFYLLMSYLICIYPVYKAFKLFCVNILMVVSTEIKGLCFTTSYFFCHYPKHFFENLEPHIYLFIFGLLFIAVHVFHLYMQFLQFYVISGTHYFTNMQCTLCVCVCVCVCVTN